MIRPQINALPCGEWLTEKSRTNIKAALIIIPFLIIIASIFSEIDFIERKPALLSIPPEIYEAIFSIIAIFIINKLRVATETFYRPLNDWWTAIIAVLSLSAVFDVMSLFEENEFGITDLMSMICNVAFGAIGIYMSKNIDEAYSGKITTFSQRLKITSILALILGLACIPLWQKVKSSDGADEQSLVICFFILAGILWLAWIITFIRALFSGLDLLYKGVEQGWTDAIYLPDNLGKPTDSQRNR